jgi:HemY protein
MSRSYLALLILVCVAAAVGVMIADQSGYVLVAYRGFRYEASLWATLLALLSVLLSGYCLLYAWRALRHAGRLINPWSVDRRIKQASKAAELGRDALTQGNWSQALQQLQRAALNTDQPLELYLGAARAATELEQYEEAERLLEQALQRVPDSELDIRLAQARLCERRGDWQQAQGILLALRSRHKKSPLLLRQLYQLYCAQSNAAEVLALLPELKKYRALTEEDWQHAQQSAWQQQIRHLADNSELPLEQRLQALNALWKKLPSALQRTASLQACYAEQLAHLAGAAPAEEWLRSALKRQYDSILLEAYGRLQASPQQQLSFIEPLLKTQADDAVLWLTVARLQVRAQQWPQARTAFERSLALSEAPQALLELSCLLAQQGQTEHSQQLLCKALQGTGLHCPIADAQTASSTQPLIHGENRNAFRQ